MKGLSTNRSILLRYGFAVLSVAVAMVVRYDLSPIAGGLAALLATVTAAVTFSAWLAGTGPAAVAATVGLTAAKLVFSRAHPCITDQRKHGSRGHISRRLRVRASAERRLSCGT